MSKSNRAFALTSILLCLLTSYALGQCSLDKEVFDGKLEVVESDSDGFPIVLGTPYEDLTEIKLSCPAGVKVTVSATKPIRAKENGGPKLKGKVTGYIIYKGETYDDNHGITLSGGFEDLSLLIGMSLRNGTDILPAANNYKYYMQLIVTVANL